MNYWNVNLINYFGLNAVSEKSGVEEGKVEINLNHLHNNNIISIVINTDFCPEYTWIRVMMMMATKQNRSMNNKAACLPDS